MPSSQRTVRETMRICSPILAAYAFEVLVKILLSGPLNAQGMLSIYFGSIFAYLPYLAAHYLAAVSRPYKAVGYWIVGFLGIPIAIQLFQSLRMDAYELGTITIFGWIIPAISSAGWLLTRNLLAPNSSKLPSYEGLVGFLLTVVLAYCAAVITTAQASGLSSITNWVFDLKVLAEKPVMYFLTCLQLGVLGVLIYGVFRAVQILVIRKYLQTGDYLLFLTSALVVVLTATPILNLVQSLLPLFNSFSLFESGPSFVSPFDYKQALGGLMLLGVIAIFSEQRRLALVAEQMKHEKTVTELVHLKGQVNPHLLFNNLNSIYGLALTNSAKVPDAIMRLSEFLRYGLSKGKLDRIPLEQEVTYLKSYLELQRLRMKDDIDLTFIWPSSPLHSIAPMMLIIILENAFKYVASPKGTNPFISFKLVIDDAKLSLSCSNSFHKLPEHSSSTKHGIDNLERRLDLLYRNQYQLSMNIHDNIYRIDLELHLDE